MPLLQLKGYTGKALRLPLCSTFAVLPPTSDAPPSSAGVVHQDYTKNFISRAKPQGEEVSMAATASFVIRGALWQQGAAGALVAFADAHAAVQLHVDVPKFQLAGLVAAAGQTVTLVRNLRAVRAVSSPQPAKDRPLCSDSEPMLYSQAMALLSARTCMDTHFSQPVIHRLMRFPGQHWV